MSRDAHDMDDGSGPPSRTRFCGMLLRRSPQNPCSVGIFAGRGRVRPAGSCRSDSTEPIRKGAVAARCPRAGSHTPGCRMPGLAGTAAMSATPAAARGRDRRRPGSGGSSPPHLVPQAKQLTLNPAVAPARVLPRQLLHHCPHLVRDRRPSRRVRISPFPLDEAFDARPAGFLGSRSGAAAGARAAASLVRRARRGQPGPVSGGRPAAAARRSRAEGRGSPRP